MEMRKEYVVEVKLSAGYDSDDVGEEGCYSAEDIKGEFISWLEDLGFDVQVTVKEV